MVQTGKTTCYWYIKCRSLNAIFMLVAILRFAQYNLAAFWSIFGNICKNEGCCGPFSLKLSGVRVEFSHVLIPLHRPWHLSHSNRLEPSLRFCLPFYCFLFLWHLLILLALNPPSCSLPDDIGGPQPGPFLVSVMGASLQSLPLPLPPPPPLHATIQHSLSLNGKTWVQWRGQCVCVCFRVSFWFWEQIPTSTSPFLKTGSVSALRSTFILFIKRKEKQNKVWM